MKAAGCPTREADLLCLPPLCRGRLGMDLVSLPPEGSLRRAPPVPGRQARVRSAQRACPARAGGALPGPSGAQLSLRPGRAISCFLQWGLGRSSIPSRARRLASGEGQEQPADPQSPGPGAGSLSPHDLPCSALSRRCTLRSDLFLLKAPSFYSSDKNNE